uniref:ZM domain-containing protein n=1 Tax=Heterorhabditis bacteriophora TaxID=37862 RepID=A0A1I7WV82_HETBA
MGDCVDHEGSGMNENLDESIAINNCETKPFANIKAYKRVFKRQKRKFSALDIDSIQSNAVYSPDVSSTGTIHNRKIKKTKRKQLAVNIDIKKKNTYSSDVTNSEIIYRGKVKKERKQKVVTLTADVFRSITSKLCCSPAFYMLKDVNEMWSAIVNEQLRQWKRNGHSINVYQFFLDKNPLCTRFYDVNDKKNMKCFHNEVRKLCKMLKNIAEIEDDGDESGLRLGMWCRFEFELYIIIFMLTLNRYMLTLVLENLSASALGWYHEYCDSRIARCPIILQEKLRDLMQHSFKRITYTVCQTCTIIGFPFSSTRFVYSKPLMKPSFFQTIVLSRVNQITCLDLGNIKLETVHPIFMNSGLINLKELVWNAACPSLLLSLPARNRLKILSLTSAESTMVGFPAIVQFTGLKKLYTGLHVPDGPTRFDLDVLLRSYQNFWNLNINYSDEAGDGVEMADSDLILSKMLNLRHISFWNAPEKVFTIMARRSLSFNTLQFGQLSQDLSRLCSLDSVMQALFKFNQPKYQIYQLNVDHLKLYLHAMPVISLDYYLPQLMMGLNESMWSIKSLDLFVHCSFGSSMPSSWSLEDSRKSSRSKMNNLTNFSLHIDGFCVVCYFFMLDDLNYHLPRSIKSVSISLVLPSTKASRAIKSLLKFIRQLSDLNSFPDLDELHLQVWGIRCAEQLLNCVSDYLSDVRKLSIICMLWNSTNKGLSRNIQMSIHFHISLFYIDNSLLILGEFESSAVSKLMNNNFLNSHILFNKACKNNIYRYVTSHTCLPWTLTEKDNKLVVDEVKPGFGAGIDTSYTTSAQSKSTWDSPALAKTIPVQKVYQNDFEKRSSQRHHGSYAAPPSNQERIYHSPSSYSNRYDSTKYSKTIGNGFTSSRDQQKFSQSGDYASNVPSAQVNSNKNSGTTPSYGTQFETSRGLISEPHGTMHNNAQEAQNYSFNNGTTTTAYQMNLGNSVPLNQAAFIETQHSPGSYFKGTSVSPEHIIHYVLKGINGCVSFQLLQYNSPINMYSIESAAEQYSQQTGRPTEVYGNSTQSPAYLNSETRKLIEEQEHGRLRRGLSPSTQSSSFKRISQAVGEPVN